MLCLSAHTCSHSWRKQAAPQRERDPAYTSPQAGNSISQCSVGHVFPEGLVCVPAWWPHLLGSYYKYYSKVESQEIPGVTGKLGLGIWNEAGQRLIRVLPRKCTGHSKHPLPTTQEKTLHVNITKCWIPKSDWLYSLQPKKEKLYTVSKNKTGSWLWLRSWTPYCQIQTEIEESRKNQ